LLRALEVGCDQQGARWLLGSAVRDVRDVSGGAEVFVDGGWHRGDAVVLCGGAWSGLIAERLRLEQSLIPVRGQILLLKPERPPLKSVVNLGNRYLVCREDGHTLVGSVEEEVGFRPGTTPEVVEALHAFACRLVPRLAGATVERSWSGFRPMTFDGFPMIGRVPETERLYVAAGHFRSGIHLSCATAVTLADLILGRSPAIDLDPFRVGKQQHAANGLSSNPPS
jgi:glycine oxidase